MFIILIKVYLASSIVFVKCSINYFQTKDVFLYVEDKNNNITKNTQLAMNELE